MDLHYFTETVAGISYLKCTTCGKRCSTGFLSVPTETPDKGIIIRATIVCPECLQTKYQVLEPV